MDKIGNELESSTQHTPFLDDLKKGVAACLLCCDYKKCCKKYKKGKRCKKCPDQ